MPFTLFCEDPTSEVVKSVKRSLTISTLSVSGAVVVISVGIIDYRLRVKLYTKWKIAMNVSVKTRSLYDVFLSCSSDNNLPHGNGLREQLEQREYRVCYPPRDFLAGETVYDNIYNAIVCILQTFVLHHTFVPIVFMVLFYEM